MNKKLLFFLIVIGVIALGLWEWKILDDPYYHVEKVNIYTWVYREIDEFIHGEK